MRFVFDEFFIPLKGKRMNENQRLLKMSLHELWQLFPIRLVPHNPCWMQWYMEERDYLESIFSRAVERISHIGSTSVAGIWAKPIIDILLEFKDKADMCDASVLLEKNGYLRMSSNNERMTYNKGYTINGFAERVFHLHLRLCGDNDELYFRDYLHVHPEIAQAYERLKLSLWKQYEYDRDAYTENKTDFIRRYTELAKTEFKLKYQRDNEMTNKNIVITVDGPSGAGKGTLCYALAQKLGFNLLDSGAIYRVAALAAMKAQEKDKSAVDFNDEITLAKLAHNLDVRFIPQDGEVQILLNGENVSAQIRTQEVADVASKVAVFPQVRAALLQLQKDFAGKKGLIADGRDMGTVVFPDAQVKLFLDASPEERAKRRYKQLQNKGINGNFEQILAEVKERDFRDRNRAIAPMKPAEDALLLDSTSLGIDEVIEKALAYIHQRIDI